MIYQLATCNEFVLGPQVYGYRWFHPELHQFDTDSAYIGFVSILCKKWIDIVQNGKIESSWYKSSDDGMQIEHDGKVIRQIDMEKVSHRCTT